MARNVLVLNCGSSSIKYQLVDADTGECAASGIAERIGEKVGSVTHLRDGKTYTYQGRIEDHAAGLDIIRRLFEDSRLELTDAGVVAVGHRVVHGGRRFTDPTVLDDATVAAIDVLSVLAPLHNPANVTGIRQARKVFPDVPHVAVFDTAFFRDLPDAAATYAIDREVARRYEVRRYGFHGTSHAYVSGKVAELLDRTDLRQIVLHLGNGASASAVRAGKPVETSMGMTPLEGLVMGSRSGDIDPGVLFHLNRQAGMSVADLDTLLNRRSGMTGLAGVNDFRDLHRLIDEGNTDAALAFDVYCHRVRKYIGAYLAVLGGLDVLTFTAGVGENDALTRAAILKDLEGLGIRLDPARNAAASREPRTISTDGSAVRVMVVPTNEELAIARATVAVI